MLVETKNKPKLTKKILDPVKFVALCWPDIRLTREQKRILYSLRDNVETVVTAGNMLGKDFIAALAVLWFFCSRHPCKVVTTSVDGTQLEDVLWGELRNFIDTSAVELPIEVNHLHLRKKMNGQLCGVSYVRGRVAAKGEGMLGHHLPWGPDGMPYTLFVGDEASGINEISFERAEKWRHRSLIIGNPFPCTNYFYKAIKRGTYKLKDGTVFCNVIKIRAEDSPNVRLGLAQQRLGIEPTGETLIDGVKGYYTYLRDRETWDAVQQCIGLDAEFYEGGDYLMFPPTWLNKSHEFNATLRNKRRRARAMGIDTAEGGDFTVWCIIDELGILEMVRLKTPDTAIIPDTTVMLMRKYNLKGEQVAFDRGGGGKQHADRMRRRGHEVRTVAFGAAATAEPKRGLTTFTQKKQADETKYLYKNKRAEMYGISSDLLEPVRENDRLVSRFGIPATGEVYEELRRQLALIPKRLDGEGRIMLPPKRKVSPNDKKETLTDILGRSPDEADAYVTAVYVMRVKPLKARAGGAR